MAPKLHKSQALVYWASAFGRRFSLRRLGGGFSALVWGRDLFLSSGGDRVLGLAAGEIGFAAPAS